MSGFKNKTVLVTGAGRGLGAALCHRFGTEGAFIIGCDIIPENLDRLSSELSENNIPHFLSPFDISDEAAVKEFFREIKTQGKSIDILINNAGITNIKLFENNTNEEFRKVMDINFMANVYTVREAYDDIVKNKGGFIAVSSVAGFAPLMGRTAYAASKHAVFGFFETLRTELKDKGVHVLIACPGFIDTELRKHTYRQGENNKNNKVTTGKNASPEEVADLIFKAYLNKKRTLVTGIGIASYYMKRFFPKIYDKLMIRKMKEGFGKKK